MGQDIAKSPEAAPGAAESPSGGLEIIIVTAQRVAEDVQRSAIAITAINGDTLAAQGVISPEALTSHVPSLNIGASGAYTQVFLRGIGDFGGNPNLESPVAVSVDEVYQQTPAVTSSFFYDLERVELLKGPQGTLYGRNASGGALNIISKKPELESLGGFLTLGGGNYSAVHSEGALNVPVSDTTAVRAAFQVIDRDGYYDDGTEDDERQGVRLQGLYEPSSNFSLLLAADYAHHGGKGSGTAIRPEPVPGNPWIGNSDPRSNAALIAASPVGPFLRPVGNDGFNDVETWGASANAEWDLGAATLSVIPAYRHFDVDTGNYNNGFYIGVKEPGRQYSLETRLAAGEEGPLKYVLGLYYFDFQQSGLFGADFGPQVQQVLQQTAESSDKSAAAFGQATYSITDSLRLTAGLRYTWERKLYDSKILVSPQFDPVTSSYRPCLAVQTPVPAPQDMNFVPGSPIMCGSDASGRQTVRKTNWKVGLEYDLSDESLLYVTASTGFKAGGFSTGAAPNAFDPEELLAFELGSKNRFFDNRLQLNLEAFHWEYTDQQISHIGPINPAPLLGFVTDNAGKATLYGLSTDIQFALTAEDLVGLGVEYLHTSYDSFAYQGLSFVATPASNGCALIPAFGPFVTVDCTGKPLIRSPEWSGNASYQHRFNLASGSAVVFGARTQFSSKYFTSVDYMQTGTQAAFTYSSADLTYQSSGERWSVTAYVQNIEDENVSAGAFQHNRAPGILYNIMKPPRTYGVRVRFNFGN